MAPGTGFDTSESPSAFAGQAPAIQRGAQTPGGTHPLAALGPTASLFGGPAAGLIAGAAGGAAERLSGAGRPLASVSSNNAVHPANVPDARTGQPPLQDRAWVEAHRRELGMPADMPAEQFFHEFLAHDLAYKEATTRVPVDPHDPSKGTREQDNYTPYEHAMLRAWGYQDRPQEVQDRATGLYAARFNPIDNGHGGQGGPAPVVAFRGTADLPGARADADRYIGASQYEPHRAEIAALMNPDHGRVVTTGHSLGGALAQKAAADNAASVSGVTTFQSPGISGSDAARFNAANRDGHIDVAHHYVSSDTVHRAGDQKLGGRFYENRVEGMDGAMSAPGLTLANVMPSHTGYMYYNNPGAHNNLRDPTNKWLGSMGRTSHVTTEEHTEDTVHSRNFHEGLRQGAGSLVTAGLASYNAGRDLGTGIANGARDTAADLGQTARRAGQGFSTAAGEGAQGVRTAATGLRQGGSAILHGNILGGLGDAGRGLAQGTGQVLRGGLDTLGTAGHAVAGTAAALGHGARDIGAGALHAGGDLVRGGATMAYQLGQSATHLAQVPGELGSWAGERAVAGGEALVHGAQWAGNQVVAGGSAALHAGGQALRSGGQAISNGAHRVASGARNALHAIGL